MANATKLGTVKADDATKSKEGRTARKLVPLEKRLVRLRKEEAKRRQQLDVVKARSQKTEARMSTLIASVDAWVKNPQQSTADGQTR
jgi:hypothetical protein